MRRVVPVLLGLGLVVGIGAWGRYLRRRQSVWRVTLAERIPVHSKYWRERGAEDGDLLYVVVGDSAAQGIGASRPAHGYVGSLLAAMRRATDRTIRVVNLSVSGARLREALDVQLPRLQKLRPDLMTVSIGANDIATFDASRFERELAELMDALPPHALIADLPSFHFLPAERRVRTANRILRRLAAERGLRVVPLHARTRAQGLWGVSTQFAGDLFHSNDRGYRVWASAFEAPLLERLRIATTESAAATPTAR